MPTYDGYFKNHVKSEYTKDWVIADSAFVYNQLQLIMKYIEPSVLTNGAIFEVGSGLGRLAHLLSELAIKDYTGIELDKEAANFANQQFGHLGYRFENADLFRLGTEDFATRKYRTVFSFEVLEHLPAPLESLKIINNLLEEGGYLVATSPFPFKKNIICDSTHLSVLHPLNWRRLLELAGFDIIVIRPMTFLPMLWRFHKKLNVILPWYVPGFKLVSTSLIIARKKMDSGR